MTKRAGIFAAIAAIAIAIAAAAPSFESVAFQGGLAARADVRFAVWGIFLAISLIGSLIYGIVRLFTRKPPPTPLPPGYVPGYGPPPPPPPPPYPQPPYIAPSSGVPVSGQPYPVVPFGAPAPAPYPYGYAPPRLVCVAGPLEGRDFPIGAGITVGQPGAAEVALYDPAVAPRHAWIGPDAYGNMLVRDGGSPAGTLVNQQRITQAQILRDNDVISIGASQFALRR